MAPDDFPLILKHSKRPDTAREQMQQIFGGLEAKAIRNVTLKDAKDSLSNVVDRVWDKEINAPYFWSGRWEQFKDTPRQPVLDLHHEISISGLHDCLSAHTKIHKCKFKDPVIDHMITVIDELFPLAKAVSELKPYIVKGRAPNPNPKPVNPNKDVKTCPCCFRGIAVQSGTMAHHGYERPGHGYQTQSCPGVRFKPFEISPEGTIWIRDKTQNLLSDRERELKDLPNLTSFTLESRDPRKPSITITPEDPRWNQQLDYRKRTLEWDVTGLKRDIASFDEKIKNWDQLAPAESTKAPAVKTPLPERPAAGWDKGAKAQVAAPLSASQQL